MKRLLGLLFLLASFQQLAFGQTLKVEVTLPDTLVGKKYLENVLRQALKNAGSQDPVIKDPGIQDPVSPSLKACEEGPILRSVFNVTPNSLTGQFHGKGVEAIDWKIQDGAGNLVRSGSVEPKNSEPSISYSALPAGSYKLIYQGKSCISDPSQPVSFTVPGGAGGVIAPPVPSNGDIFISGYFARNQNEAGADFKTRIDNGDPPYSIVCKSFEGATVFSRSGVLDDEVSIPDNAVNAGSGIRIEVVDSKGERDNADFDRGSLYAMKGSFIGFSVANGDAKDHVKFIEAGDALGFSGTGVIFENSNFRSNEDLLRFERAGKFDPSKPLSDDDIFRYDKTFLALSKAKNARKIRINIHLKRPQGIAYAGDASRSFFVSFQDSQMRPDGSTPLVRQKGNWDLGDYFNIVVPSPAAQATEDMAVRLGVAYINRYIDFFNSGQVVAMGFVFTSSGEAEINFKYQVSEMESENYDDSPNPNGDFHPASVALFKRTFPQYAGLDNHSIANAPYGSDLFLKWQENNNRILRNFERNTINKIYEKVTALTRVRILQIDSGSLLDGLAPHRKTLNSTARMEENNRIAMIKVNDGVYDQRTNRFIISHLSSAAAKAEGAVSVWEESPWDYENPSNIGPVSGAIRDATGMGVGTSLYTANIDFGRMLISAAGVKPGDVPGERSNFKTVNGQKRAVLHKIDISQVYKNGGLGGGASWQGSWEQLAREYGLDYLNTVATNDVMPVGQ